MNIATTACASVLDDLTPDSDVSDEDPLKSTFKMEVDYENEKTMESDEAPMEKLFSLKDDSHIADLLQVASDLDIFFTFSNKRYFSIVFIF